MHGFLKFKFEQYLAGACVAGGTQGISLRLEYPGFQSDSAGRRRAIYRKDSGTVVLRAIAPATREAALG